MIVVKKDKSESSNKRSRGVSPTNTLITTLATNIKLNY